MIWSLESNHWSLNHDATTVFANRISEQFSWLNIYEFKVLSVTAISLWGSEWWWSGLLWVVLSPLLGLNTLRTRQNGRHFADNTFKRIFLNENVWISFKNSLKFVLYSPINNIPALVQIMAWRRPGDKPLAETMMVRLPMHICITRPQWVKPMSEAKIRKLDNAMLISHNKRR